ncbi:6-phosphogluconolactonase [Bifidobacterium dolichotidis]|uniref:6-phosphogluconolactonase n=1 Tax=Bifidobacterium dolichotidis TaxID=2306976 RepID=A0A430FSH5_9BIFI|nr:6-phosphogluconolactonase [Bifidobacterium dolichotidis]RSX55836.1 6-phosphogluconolactonase [Bifidobacterium dolichotidis]
MRNRTVIKADTRDAVAECVADRFIETVRTLLMEPDRVRVDVALSGGTDGTAVLRAINDSPMRDTIDWTRVHIWWGDERFVNAESDERNARGARKALLNTLMRSGAIDGSQVHEMPADPRTPEEIEAADQAENDELLARVTRAFQATIIEELGLKPTMSAIEDPELAKNHRTPALDIAMFGIGPDGHFASLFPGFPQTLIDDANILCVGVSDSPKQPPLRTTLTVPMINHSARVWLIGSGEAKAQAVKETYSRRNDPDWPASFARGTQETIWFTDQM